jgi:hypothetical protein
LSGQGNTRARTRGAAFAVVVAVFAAGCGGGGASAGDVLGQTADRLGEIGSGELRMRLLVTPAERPTGVGLELDGPFSLGGGEPLPVTRMRYTRILGGQRTSAVLTSTGREAFLTSDGTTTRLDEETARTLAGAAGGDEPRSLSDLGLTVDAWFQDAELADGPEVDGEATDRISGRLRTGRAVRDVLAALERAGAPVPAPGERLEQRIDQAVRSSTAEVITGEEDRLLRRLSIDVELGPGRELDAAIPGAGAVHLTASLELVRLNERIEVSAPE